MGSSAREEIVGVFDALDAELDRLCGLTFEVLTTPERLAFLEASTVTRYSRTNSRLRGRHFFRSK
ncbi:hypothetical protein [Mycobacterium riyadhense]|uniref:hypothetical protein n=1 Tax=Mycobacterium riyadhense TaxID=486698 RepID=UPI001951FFE3|nr:hypothetical protein [Mycobacterium riyadhense]